MSQFISIDLNGWLDRLFEPATVVGSEVVKEKASALGFRSCLFRHEEDVWLFGAQALSVARHAPSNRPLIDAFDALAETAGNKTCASAEPAALPAALWQLAVDAGRRTERRINLALVIPDGRILGTPSVQQSSGKTALETLHEALVRARPPALATSRIELVWRSVAVLKSILDRGELLDAAGEVLIISVYRRTFWTVLEIRPWPGGPGSKDPLCIARKPVMDDCDKDEAWTARRAEAVRAALADQAGDFDAIHRWTRWVEILASGMQAESLATLGYDVSSLEHRSWPASGGTWMECPRPPSIPWCEAFLPAALERQIDQFRNQSGPAPLGIVVENPAGIEMTADLEALIRRRAPNIPIFRATGTDVARAASRLAESLGRDKDSPAWLDAVPAIELEVRSGADGDGNTTEWMPIVPGNVAIPAGQTHHSKPCRVRRATLAPGIEQVHLHLRRGHAGAWHHQYAGRLTGHVIQPSDHVRIVEPLARVRPLSGEARIEIVEHFPNGTSEALSASRTSIGWSEMSETPNPELGSIPELYVFKASPEGWGELEPLLREVLVVGTGEARNGIRNGLYNCTQNQWRGQTFPLGSDGRPHQTDDPQQYRLARELLGRATDVLLSDLEHAVRNRTALQPGVANRMHLALTWLFTGCPERVVEILLDAILNPAGDAGITLHIANDWSAWAIYSGVGRAVRSNEMLRMIFDSLVGKWEDAGGQSQDRFLLAAVTHPMARRVGVRRVLNESQDRFERVKRFLGQQLDNVLAVKHDPRCQSQPSLELRYVTMGYRGLCQVRYANSAWFPHDGDEAREACAKLRQARAKGNAFVQDLVDRTAPYLIGEGVNPTMPGGF